MDPSEENHLREAIQEFIALMSDEWLQEGESSLNPIQLNSPSSSFRCRLLDHNVDALYSPTVGANLMSDEFALAFLGNQMLTSIDRQLKRPSGSLMSSYGVLINVSFWRGDVKVHQNFHVFDDLNFDFLIGHPIKALLKVVPKTVYLNINVGKDTLHIPIERAINCSVEDTPTLELITQSRTPARHSQEPSSIMPQWKRSS